MTRDHPAASRPVAGTRAASLENIRLEPRCRVCRNDELRQKVNTSLASGMSYAMIVRTLAADNAVLDQRDRVTIDTVRNHSSRHFPVQNVAQATYREILERRAAENAVDFVDGVATAITPMAFLESVMVKSYEDLVDTDTNVDVATGVNAAVRLQTLLDARGVQPDIARLQAQVQQVGEAVKSVVPKDMWAEILARLDDPPPGTRDADLDPLNPDEEFDPEDEYDDTDW